MHLGEALGTPALGSDHSLLRLTSQGQGTMDKVLTELSSSATCCGASTEEPQLTSLAFLTPFLLDNPINTVSVSSELWTGEKGPQTRTCWAVTLSFSFN